MQSLLSPAKQHVSVNCYSQSFYYDQMLYNPAQIELSPRKWMILREAAAAGDFSDSAGCKNALRVKRETKIRTVSWNLPGGPVVKTLCFHCREHKFDPWSGEMLHGQKVKKKKKKIVSSVLGLYAFCLFFLHSDFLQGIS